MNKFKQWLIYKMGYRIITRVNTSPPDNLFREIEPGKYVRPGGFVACRVNMKLNVAGRLRLMLSGSIQVVYVGWCAEQPVLIGDHMAFEINPPGVDFTSKPVQ